LAGATACGAIKIAGFSTSLGPKGREGSSPFSGTSLLLRGCHLARFALGQPERVHIPSRFPRRSLPFKEIDVSRLAKCISIPSGLLKRHPITATGFHLIGKETERGWEQNDYISTLMPSVVRCGLEVVLLMRAKKAAARNTTGFPRTRGWIEPTHHRPRATRAAGAPEIAAIAKHAARSIPQRRIKS
jgi:hypothetical protein